MSFPFLFRLIAMPLLVQGFAAGQTEADLSVTRFGAVCDGASDSTVAFARAIEFLKVRRGGTLHVPRGTCNVSRIVISGAGTNNIVIEGDGVESSILQHTGTGVAVYIGQPVSSGASYGQGVRNITISGGKKTTIGLYLQAANHGLFSDIRIKNAPTEFQCESCVANKFENIRISANEPGMATTCINGMIFDHDPVDATSSSQGNTIVNPILEGCSGAHILMKHAVLNTFIGGTAESGSGIGVALDPKSSRNLFITLDTESLGVADYVVSGIGNTIVDPIAAGNMDIAANAAYTTVVGGFVHNLSDAGTGTVKQNILYDAMTETGSQPTDFINVLSGKGLQPSTLPTDLAIKGVRPLSLSGGSSESAVTKQGDSRGWAFRYGAAGSGGADLGGWGIFGIGNQLGCYYAGTYDQQLLSVCGKGKVNLFNLPMYPNNSAAIAGGLAAGAIYRTGGDPDVIAVVH